MPFSRLFTTAPAGDPDAPLLILGPALGAPAAMWGGVGSTLAAHYRVQAFENFGFGDAPTLRAPFSMADLADAVVRIIDEAGAATAFYAGDSLNGAVGLEVARRHGDRLDAVVTMCSVARTARDPSMAPLADIVRRGGTASRAADVGDRWFSPGAMATRSDEIAALVAAVRGADDQTYIHYLEALDAHDIGDHLHEIEVPVLAVWSEFDPGDGEARMRFIAENVQRGALVGIQGAGHVPPLEKPREVADVLHGFFRTVS